ncbi:protein-L-isoaspartate(D-aspartate) O-methyltransferase [Prolixibacteraceae bacterium JC049]|nr:protein-L-isoaspartate(D-aspartate) O-methyltransferase [Prolixibacteraceae bacterium JC049]
MNDLMHHQGMRRRLVDGLRTKGIRDERVLEAIGKVPRHLFMDSGFVKYSYKDQAFPIGAGQTISQPFTVAYQSQLLEVEPNAKVLEVGTGSGYQAAVLLELGAKVFSIERQKELYVKTENLMTELGYRPRLFFGDGYKGLPTYGPFDRIIVTAGAPYLPEDLMDQLKVGGRMVIPLGSYERQEMTVYIKTSEDSYEKQTKGDFVFVPMLKGTAQ